MEHMNTIARFLELCEERNLSVYAVAQRSNIPYDTLKAAVRRNTQLTVFTIECICEGLGIPPYVFFLKQAATGGSSLPAERRDPDSLSGKIPAPL